MAILVFAFTGKRFVSGTWTRLHQVANGARMSAQSIKGTFRKKRKQPVPCTNPGKHTINMWCRDNIEKCFCRISVNKTGYPEQASGRLETGENNRFAGMEHNGETAYGTIILPGNNQCILAADLSVPCRPVQGSGWTQ